MTSSSLNFHATIDSIMSKNKDQKFYITCDNYLECFNIHEKYKNNVISEPTEELERSHITLALISLINLGSSSLILASKGSSFSTVASAFGRVDGKKTIIKVVGEDFGKSDCYVGRVEGGKVHVDMVEVDVEGLYDRDFLEYQEFVIYSVERLSDGRDWFFDKFIEEKSLESYEYKFKSIYLPFDWNVGGEKLKAFAEWFERNCDEQVSAWDDVYCWSYCQRGFGLIRLYNVKTN